jgi:hypothetical protein
VRSRDNPADVHWSVDSAGHVLSLAVSPEEFAARVRAFLDSLPVTAASVADAEIAKPMSRGEISSPTTSG